MDARLTTSGMTAGLLYPLCHARRSPSVIPAGPPLSFPQVLAGIQCLFLLSFIRGALHGNSPGCPINNVGHDSGPALDPLACPPGPPLSFPQFLAGIQCLFLLSLHSWGPAWKNHGCPIKNVGHDSGRLENVWHDSGPTLPPLSCQPVPFVMPVGPLCHARWSPLSCPRVPSVIPAGPLCHSRGSSVMPAGPPLSFPPVLAGIQCLFLLSLYSWGLYGNSHGCPINNVGHDSGPALDPLACPPVPPLSFPPVLAGIQCLFLLSLYSCGIAWEQPWMPD